LEAGLALADELQQRCDTISGHLRSRQLATDDEIKACFDQPGDDEIALVFAYGDLRALHAERERPAGHRRTDEEAEILAALSDKPEVVSIGHGKPCSVYPKSFDALQTLARIGQRIDYLLGKTREMLEAGIAVSDDLYERVDREVLHLYRALTVGVTHDGPTLPFDSLESIEFPTWVIVLSPLDIRTIHAAFVRVNAARLAVLTHLLSIETGADKGPGHSWATFFSLRSDDSHIPSPTLMRDHSLPSQMAAALIATSTRMKAMKEQERR
jgi:hypothetical protein